MDFGFKTDGNADIKADGTLSLNIDLDASFGETGTSGSTGADGNAGGGKGESGGAASPASSPLHDKSPANEHIVEADAINGVSDPVPVPSGELYRFVLRRGAAAKGLEFSVKIVDGAGEEVAGVPLIFLAGSTSRNVKSGSDGIAKVRLEADRAEVFFESAESLSKVMRKWWLERPPTIDDNSLQPNDEVTVAVARPSAVETPEGEAFAPISAGPCMMKTISIRPAQRRLSFIEMIDTLFRTDSAVALPEGEAPTDDTEGHESLNSVGVVATILRYNEEHQDPPKKILIAGHCDTKASVEYNQTLSEERAGVVHAMLTGDRDAFIRLCDGRHDEIDVTQIFDWTTRAYGFTCKPTTLTAIPNNERYRQFRESYNQWLDERDPAVEPDPRGSSALSLQGRLDQTIWGAVFDLYEHNLRRELGGDGAEVSALREKIVWVDDGRQALGFSEHFPIDNAGRDDYRSQTNRRVEVLFFDPDEEPDLDAGGGAPESCEIYLPGNYIRIPLEPMASAKRAKGGFQSDQVVEPGDCNITIDGPESENVMDPIGSKP